MDNEVIGLSQEAIDAYHRDRLKQKANGHAAKKAEAVPKQFIKLIPFEQIKLSPDCRPYRVKGLIPTEGITVVWGPPKSGKSFAVFDMCMHIALGWEYRGRRVHQGSVVYCSFEGQAGLAQRIEAFRQKHLAEDCEIVPFVAQTMALDLVRQVDDLISSITASNITPAVVTLDTLNRSLKGSENSDEDMGNYIKAADRIWDAFGCAVIIIHHCGVDGTRPRGHTSLGGAVAAQLACSRDRNNNVNLKVEWMKDGDSEGEVVTSRLEKVEVGEDADGDLITSCIVLPAETVSEAARRKPLPANQQTMLTILQAAGKEGLLLNEWNEKAKDQGIGINRRASLYDAQQALRQLKLVHSYGDRWYANSATQ
jgi:hypothetical protein